MLCVPFILSKKKKNNMFVGMFILTYISKFFVKSLIIPNIISAFKLLKMKFLEKKTLHFKEN